MYHPSKLRNAPVALVLHPNPERGGDMNNKVAYLLYRIFAERGFSVLRFNFRGVGRSEGTSGDGELNDASACLNWLCAHNIDPSDCYVAGYSFGAFIGMQLLMRRPEVKRFIALTPPANLYDFSFLAPCPIPGLMVQGAQDILVPKEAVVRFANRLNLQKSTDVTLKVIRGADHGFVDHLKDVYKHTAAYIEKYVTMPA
ncbi:MAG: alpha/beta fold hydrolase [Holosporaceae bacterium]